MHCTCHKKNRVESRALQASSCNNLNKGVLQPGSSEGGLQWQREGQQPRATRSTVLGARDLESTVAQGFVKHGFKGAASPCRRWPIASFMLYGLTNPVRLHAVYPCIWGLTGRNELTLLLLREGERVLLLGERERVLLLRERERVLLLRERECVLLLRERECVLLLRERECVLLLRERECVLLLRERECVQLLRERECVLLLRERECVLLLRERECVLLLKEREHVLLLKEREHVLLLKESNESMSCC